MNDEDSLEELNEDIIQTLPLQIDYGNGLQMAIKRLYLLNHEQMLACLVENRIDKKIEVNHASRSSALVMCHSCSVVAWWSRLGEREAGQWKPPLFCGLILL